MVISKNVDAWKDKITKMTYQELGNVEYQTVGIGSKWKNMFELLERETLRCVLCETNKIGSWVSIKQHIEGKRHLGKFRVAVRDVRHRTIKLNPGGAQNQKPKVSTQSPIPAKTTSTQGKPPTPSPGQPIKSATAGNTAQAVKSPAASSISQAGKTPTASSTSQAGKTPTVSSTVEAGKSPAASSTGQAAKSPAASSTGQAGKSPVASSTGQAGKSSTASSTGQARKSPAASSPGQAGKPSGAGNAPLSSKSGTNTTQSTPPNTLNRQELTATQKQLVNENTTASQSSTGVIDSQKATVMAASPGGKKVLNPCSLQVKSNEEKKPAYKTLQEFRNDLIKLELSDILLVEYRYVNTDYVFLFQRSDNNYTCKMCRQSGISNLQSIRTHMGNKQHQTNISLVKTLHHPVLYPTKEKDENVQRAAAKEPTATVEPPRIPPPSTPAPTRLPQPSTPAPSRLPPPSTPAPSKIQPPAKPLPTAVKPTTPVSSKSAPSVAPSSSKSPQTSSPGVSSKVDNSKQNDPNKNEENKNVEETIDDRHNGKNLIPLMKTLDVPELLKIEYRYSQTDWKRMLSQVHESAYKCLLCSTFLIKTVYDLRNHIGSIRHQSAIKSCEQLHHPELAPVKRPIEQRKMTDMQFRDHVLKLTVSELCEIEYLMKSSWYKLVSCTPSLNRYSCYLCDLINASGSINNVRIHLTSKRHLERMESVQMLFHPLYTASKQELQAQVIAMSEVIPQNVVCTIELDDSPDREIPKSNEKPKTVINPAALAITNTDTSNLRQGSAIKTIMNIGKNPQKTTADYGSQNIQSGNQFYQNENQSWQSGPKASDLNRFDEISLMRTQSNQFNQTMGPGNQLDSMRSQTNNFNKSMSMGYHSQGNNFGQPQMHRNQFDQTMLGSSQGNYFGQSQPMGPQITPLMGPGNNLCHSRNMVPQNIHNRDINPTDGINQYPPTQNNSVQRFQPANSNLRKQYGPNAQQGDRIIIPRVQQKDDNSNNKSVPFTNKDIMSDTIQPAEGLIGVEYVVKILRNANDPTPRYECCLCEVEVDGISMQWHLKGLHHRSKYLDRHFPTVMKQFQQYANKPEMSYIMSQITDKLAIAIEEYHGRDLPFECLIDEFRLNHDGIKSKVFSFRHPSELTGPSFTNIVDRNSLDEFVAKKSFRMPEPDKKRKPTFDVNDTVQAKRLREMSPPNNATRENINRNQSQTMQDNTERNRRFERTSLGRRHQSRSRSRERYHSPSDGGRRYQQHNNRDDWDSYMRMFDHSLVDLKKDYEEYKKDPECHPAYDSEWKKFWTTRTEELRTEGRNPSTYNFQPEWVKFFSRRVHEIFEEKVEDLRVIIRKRLNLPLHNNNHLRDEVYHVGVDRISRISYDIDIDQERHPQFNQGQQRQSQYNQSQQQQHNNKGKFDDTQRQGQFNSAQQQTNQRRSIEDYDPEDLYRRQIDEQMNEPKVDNKIIENVAAKGRANDDGDDDDIIEIVDIKTEAVDIDDDKNMSVSVLRLLTALEDHLGILGPRVIDLLSKALTLEKIKPYGVDEALLNHENYVFLETVREKLKGQLLAGVIEGPKERAVKKVINDMNTMLDKYKDSIQSSLPVPAIKEAPVPPKMTPVKKPAAVTLNKEELATKLASALAAQGKTDVTPEQLEQLVGVYALIERKQRENAIAGKSPHQSNQKKSLSDTLIDFLKPTNSNATPPPSGVQKQHDRNNYGSMNQTSFTTSTPSSYTNQMYRSRSPSNLMDSYQSQRMNQSQKMNRLQNMNQSQNMNQTQRMEQTSSYGGNYSSSSGSMYQSSSQSTSSSFSFIKTPFSSLSQFDTSLKLNTEPIGKWGTFVSTNRRSNEPPMISYPDPRRNNANNSGIGLSNRTNIWNTSNQGSQQNRNDNSDNFGIWQQGGSMRRF